MVRSKLQNKYNKEPSINNQIAYKRKRNICTNLLRKIKFNFYNNLNPTSISDNKTFWRNVKPMFSEKKSSNTNINLVENHEVISDNNKILRVYIERLASSVLLLTSTVLPGGKR